MYGDCVDRRWLGCLSTKSTREHAFCMIKDARRKLRTGQKQSRYPHSIQREELRHPISDVVPECIACTGTREASLCSEDAYGF